MEPSEVWLERLAGYTIPEADRPAFEDPELFLDRLYNDPLFFLRAIWVDRGFYSVAPLGDLEEDAFLWLDHGPRTRGLTAFRGFGKTHLIASLCCRRYFRDPNRQIVLVSKSEPATKKTLFMVKSWLKEVWFLKHLAPEDGARDAATYFDVAGSDGNRQQSMYAVGLGGQLENNRAHTVIGDDIETKTNTKTLDGRLEVRRLWTESIQIVYPFRAFKDGGPVDPSEIITIGTPKHEDTLYLDQIKNGVSFRGYPIAAPKENEKVIALAPIIRKKMDEGLLQPGSPTVPDRFPRTEIAERMKSGYTEFARENMLIADLADTNRYPLRLADLIVMDVPKNIAPIEIVWGKSNSRGSTALVDVPALGIGEDRCYGPIHIEEKLWEPYATTRAGIDPAGRGDDRTGLAIGSLLTGRIWVKKVLGLPGGLEPHKLDLVASTLREHDARQVHFETNIDVFGSYQNELSKALARHFVAPGDDSRFPNGWACRIESTRAQGQKEVRIIEVLEPYTSTHMLIVDRSVVMPDEPYEQYNDFQFQFSRITKQVNCLREDGKLDALSILVQSFKDYLRTDPEKAAARKKAEKAKAEIDQAYAFLKIPRGRSVMAHSR